MATVNINHRPSMCHEPPDPDLSIDPAQVRCAILDATDDLAALKAGFSLLRIVADQDCGPPAVLFAADALQAEIERIADRLTLISAREWR